MKYYITSRISENISETPEGYLICIGVPIARTGEMIYGEGETPLEADEEGKVSITRDESEVFRPETIASFQGKAITIAHPKEFVGPENWNELAKGIMQNVRRGKDDQKDDLIADLLITDKMAIGLVKKGLRSLSCGYEADYVQDTKGKGKQKNIIGNHLALVDQGRAGPGYEINDHKGDTKMKLKDRIKAIFDKAQLEAVKVADEEMKEAKDEDDKDDDKESKDAGAYDELVKMVKDLGEKISAMAPKDEEADDDDEDDKDKKDSKDDDDKESKDDDAMESRIKALEAAVEKLLEGEKGEDEDEDKDDKKDKADDEEEEDDDFEESSMTGDTASRAEILAPGIKMSKDVRVKALKTCYGTKEGKKVIDSLTGGKAPTYDSAEKVDVLFVAASEVLKASRTEELKNTKKTTDEYLSSIDNEGVVTADKMNEINEKFYKRV